MFCTKVAAAVSELREEYKDRVVMTVVAMDEDDKTFFAKHVKDNSHGLLAFDPEGEVVDSIAGHNFGKKEIRTVVDKLIAN